MLQSLGTIVPDPL